MKKFIIPKPMAVAELPVRGTPDNLRQAKSKKALVVSGGRRVSVNLTSQAVSDLIHIKARDGVDNTGAIIAALRRHAKG